MVKSKLIIDDNATFEIRPDGIIHLIFKEGVTLDCKIHARLKEIYESLEPGHPKKLMISAEDFIITEKLFWERCKKSERFAKGQMIAAIAPSLAQKIIARNYLYKYKPENPFKIFNDAHAATNWLLNSEI